jgi:hypothetical protein
LNFSVKRPGSFGLLLTKEKDPRNPGEFKRLTYGKEGESNDPLRVELREELIEEGIFPPSS